MIAATALSVVLIIFQNVTRFVCNFLLFFQLVFPSLVHLINFVGRIKKISL